MFLVVGSSNQGRQRASRIAVPAKQHKGFLACKGRNVKFIEGTLELRGRR